MSGARAFVHLTHVATNVMLLLHRTHMLSKYLPFARQYFSHSTVGFRTNNSCKEAKEKNTVQTSTGACHTANNYSSVPGALNCPACDASSSSIKSVILKQKREFAPKKNLEVTLAWIREKQMAVPETSLLPTKSDFFLVFLCSCVGAGVRKSLGHVSGAERGRVIVPDG